MCFSTILPILGMFVLGDSSQRCWDAAFDWGAAEITDENWTFYNQATEKIKAETT